jgi:hypothetical protein
LVGEKKGVLIKKEDGRVLGRPSEFFFVLNLVEGW